MSADNVFSRWSRRKLAARQPGLPGKEEENAAPAPRAGTHAGPVEAEPVEGERIMAELVDAEPADAEPAEDGLAEDGTAEPLPRIEELDAGSDLSAFLRKGVPAALKNRALRKMWSLDPAIRDYVGPAEYAWDFNTPGSMPGFGPLEAGSPVVDFLSTTARSVLTGRDEEAETAQGVAGARPETEDKPAGIGRGAPPESQAGAAPDETAAAEPEPAEPEHSPELAADADAAAAGRRASAESPDEPVRPRHGGALPR